MANRLSRAGVLALVGAAPALACPRVVRAATPIRMGAVVADTYAEGLFALDAGFFSRAGIDVDLHIFPGSGAVAMAAAGNAVDVGMTDAVVLANAANGGVPLAAIAGSGLYIPGQATAQLVISANAPFTSAKDFEGKTMAVVTLVSISSTAVKAWLARGGADVSKVRFIEMPFPQMPSAIALGTVAGAFLAEPTLSQTVGTTLRIIADAYSAIGNRFLISNWFTTRDWLARNRDLARKLVATIYDSARWANLHQDLTAPMLVKYAKLDPAVVHVIRRCPYVVDPLRPDLLQPVLDAAARFSTISRPVDARSIIATV